MASTPSGLALDSKDGVLFSVCDNKMMAVADMKTLKVLATPAIGASEGTLTIVKNVGGKWSKVDTVQTERGTRRMTSDPKTHRIYLLAAKYPPRRSKTNGGSLWWSD